MQTCFVRPGMHDCQMLALQAMLNMCHCHTPYRCWHAPVLLEAVFGHIASGQLVLAMPHCAALDICTSGATA